MNQQASNVPHDLTGVPVASPVSRPPGALYAVIAGHPFFQGMAETHLKMLAGLAMQMRFLAGAHIFKQGELANRFYLILEGRVEITSQSTEAGAALIETLSSGDQLGWSWLFEPHFFHFSALALTTTKAIFFYGTVLRQQCDDDHELGFAIMKRIARGMTRDLSAYRQSRMVSNRPSPAASK